MILITHADFGNTPWEIAFFTHGTRDFSKKQQLQHFDNFACIFCLDKAH